MPPRLILNADDFGLTPGINRAIVALSHAGALTSATLMATGPAFEDAVLQARTAPGLGLGCHVVLVDGTPASPPHTIPSLLSPDRKTFRRSLLHFAHAALSGRVHADDILRESLAQVQKLQSAGIAVTHLDTHKHAHLFPPVTTALLAAARRAGIRAVRNPFEPSWSRRLHQGTPARHLQLRLLSRLERRFDDQLARAGADVLTTDGTIGIAATGRLDTDVLHDLIRHIPDGTWELVCHPGLHDVDLDRANTRLRSHRETELRALLAVIPALRTQPGAPDFLHFGDLARPAPPRNIEGPAPAQSL